MFSSDYSLLSLSVSFRTCRATLIIYSEAITETVISDVGIARNIPVMPKALDSTDRKKVGKMTDLLMARMLEYPVLNIDCR